MLDILNIIIDTLSIKNNGNEKIFQLIQNICTQQNHCFASVCAECIIIL